MVTRVKIVGYYTPSDPREEDEGDPTGLTSEAYDNLILGESGRGLAVADLEGIEVTAVTR